MHKIARVLKAREICMKDLMAITHVSPHAAGYKKKDPLPDIELCWMLSLSLPSDPSLRGLTQSGDGLCEVINWKKMAGGQRNGLTLSHNSFTFSMLPVDMV